MAPSRPKNTPKDEKFHIHSNKSRIYAISSGSQKGMNFISPHFAPTLPPHFQYPLALHLPSMEWAPDIKRGRHKRLKSLESAQLWPDVTEENATVNDRSEIVKLEEKRGLAIIGEGEGLGVRIGKEIDLDKDTQSQCPSRKVEKLESLADIPEETLKKEKLKGEKSGGKGVTNTLGWVKNGKSATEEQHIAEDAITAISKHLSNLTVSVNVSIGASSLNLTTYLPSPLISANYPPSPPISPPSTPSDSAGQAREWVTSTPLVALATPPILSPSLEAVTPRSPDFGIEIPVPFFSLSPMEQKHEEIEEEKTKRDLTKERKQSSTPSNITTTHRRRHSHPQLPETPHFPKCRSKSAYDPIYSSLPSSMRDSLCSLLTREDVLRGMRILNSPYSNLRKRSSPSSSSSPKGYGLRRFSGHYISSTCSPSKLNKTSKRPMNGIFRPGNGTHSGYLENMDNISRESEIYGLSSTSRLGSLRLGIIKGEKNGSLTSLRALGRRGGNRSRNGINSASSSSQPIAVLVPKSEKEEQTPQKVKQAYEIKTEGNGEKIAIGCGAMTEGQLLVMDNRFEGGIEVGCLDEELGLDINLDFNFKMESGIGVDQDIWPLGKLPVGTMEYECYQHEGEIDLMVVDEEW